MQVPQTQQQVSYDYGQEEYVEDQQLGPQESYMDQQSHLNQTEGEDQAYTELPPERYVSNLNEPP